MAQLAFGNNQVTEGGCKLQPVALPLGMEEVGGPQRRRKRYAAQELSTGPHG